jgi:hypothetical protein
MIAAAIPLAALHWSFPELPQTHFYIIGVLKIDVAGWTITDYTGASETFPVGIVKLQKGKPQPLLLCCV